MAKKAKKTAPKKTVKKSPKKPARAKKSSANEAVLKYLNLALADNYLLALKTHGFHWNVEGPQFPQLHAMFETQYDALIVKADEVAERLRALDVHAPASYAQFSRLGNIVEETTVPSTQGMIAQLLSDYETLAHDLKKGIEAADDADDVDTEDLLTGQMREAEKTAWMLRATLRGK